MITNEQNSIKNSLVLHELSDKFIFLINLFNKKKFPKVLMLSGKKGIGKSTLINHLITCINDRPNYNLKNNTINNHTSFYKRHLNNTFPDIIYLEGLSYKNVKVEDIRNLKSILLKSSLSGSNRFVILDDVELFNVNSLNALLKVIEERVLDFMERDIELLMSYLYRLDVAAHDIQAALAIQSTLAPHKGLALLIHKRQMQRIATKKAYPQTPIEGWEF